jgi:uncharacterized protein (TIGR02646 family)
MLYFEKSQPAPNCLAIEKQKANGDYKCGCVLERLKTDFKNKCYICESKAPSTINVEHFKAHQGNKNLKFDWNNLFWSCSHCNNTKLAKFENILNCTDSNDAIENKLNYGFKPFPREKVSITINSNDDKTLQTQTLLLAVFNGTTTLKEIESDNIRSTLLKEIKDLQEWLIEYFTDTSDEQEKDRCLRKIKQHLNKASAFTSFKRQIIKDNADLFNEFASYLD